MLSRAMEIWNQRIRTSVSRVSDNMFCNMPTTGKVYCENYAIP